MTIKDRIILELDQTPEFLLEQVFNFLRFLKSTYRLGQANAIQTGVVAESPNTAYENDLPAQALSEADRLARLNQLFGAWADQPDLNEIFEGIEQDRHAYRGRSIDSLD